MSYLVFFLLLITLLIVTYIGFKNNITSPSFISVLVFLASFICSALGLFTWNTQKELSFELIITIISGLTAFIIGEFISRVVTKDKSKVEHNVIRISKTKNIITIIFLVLTMILLILGIKQICARYGLNTWNIPKLLSFYRTKTKLFSTSLNESAMDINFFVKQMQKISLVIGYFYTYIYINNFICDKADKSNRRKLLIPIIISALTSLLYNGGRSSFMHLFVAIIFTYILILRDKLNFKEFNKKVIRIFSRATIIGIILLFALLPLIGRDYSNISKYDYTTFILGTHIPSFNKYITKENKPKSIVGYDTFSSIYYVMNKFDIIDYSAPLTHDWTWYVEGLTSNTYTGMWDYYSDFGILGVILFEFIIGFVIYKFYSNFYKGNVVLDIFVMINMYTIVDQIRDEQFITLFNTSTIAIILIIFILHYFYFKVGVKNENR